MLTLYNNCVKRLDTLFNMRLNGELTLDEYNAKKEELTREKAKYDELLKDTYHRQETWLNRAERVFDFAETAKQRFETGTLDDKQEILSCLGSTLILTDRKLHISMNDSLALFFEVAPDVQALHNRLEPLQSEAPQGFWEAHYAQNSKWGPGVGW